MQIGLLLRLPYLALERRVAERLAGDGYSDFRPAHNQVLQHLPPEGARLSELASAANITKQSMMQLVDSLEQGGYLRRRPDPTDGRAFILLPTARAQSVYQIVHETIGQVEKEWAARIGKKRFDALVADLRSLCEIPDME
jgi:DNA-binding MarR family transcriptional regulator